MVVASSAMPWPVVARAGQYKAPVGLERLQSASAIVFLERAFPTELAPNRDRGVFSRVPNAGSRV
jgi:phosphate-selective porin OprO/OprP